MPSVRPAAIGIETRPSALIRAMTIEDMEARVETAVANGGVPRHWRIAMPMLWDLIRYAPGGAALILAGDGVRIAGLRVEIGETDDPVGVELICEARLV
jgi:hypothetical protein